MKNRAFLRHLRAMTDTTDVRPDFGLLLADVGAENAFVRASFRRDRPKRDFAPTSLPLAEGRTATASRLAAEDFSIVRGAAFRFGADDLAVELV